MTAARLVAVIALAAMAVRGEAVDVNGALGGGYAQSDSWNAGGHTDVKTWDWEASLAASGDPFRPGLLRWLAGGEYRTLRSVYFNSTERTDALAYQGQLSLLSDTALPLSFSASRARTDFSTSEKGAIGSSLVTTWGSTALLHPERYPSLRLSLSRSEVDNQSLGAPEALSDSTHLGVSASQSFPSQQYQIGYDTSWNHGTYAVTNYRSHAVNAQASSSLADDVLFHAYERYYLRDPLGGDVTNPRYDDNAFGAGVQWRPGKTTASFEYGYRHLLVEVRDAAPSEQLGHSFSQSTFYRWTPDISVSGTAGVAYSLERLGLTEIRSTAESLGAGVTWRRQLGKRFAVNAGGGGSIGMAEPNGRPTTLQYGAAGSAGVTMSTERLRASAAYAGTIQETSSSRAVDHRVTIQGEGVLGRVYLNGLASLSAAQRDDELLGTSLSRAATFSLSGIYRQLNAQLSVGVSDGLSESLSNPLASNGFVLPITFNSTTRFATLSSGYFLDRGRLSIFGIARTMETTAPGRPLQYEHAFSLTSSYSLGAFVLSLEERFSIGGAGDTQQRGNMLVVRATRSFGFSL